jgi:hypothetical protein
MLRHFMLQNFNAILFCFIVYAWQSLNILTLISTHTLQMVEEIFFYAIDEGLINSLFVLFRIQQRIR